MALTAPKNSPPGVVGPVFQPALYVPDASRPPAWLCDIDGTVARTTGRSPYDLTRVHEDVPIEHTVTILRKLAVDSTIVLVSGRQEKSRTVTQEWLRAHGVPFDLLLMRADGDGRPDFQVKYELFDQHVRSRFYVLGVFDDRLSVCRMWAEIGIPLLRLGVPDHDDF